MDYSMNYSGYCPVQKGEYTIDVSYIDASTTDGRLFIKGNPTCERNKSGKVCDARECPIYKNAPDTKR